MSWIIRRMDKTFWERCPVGTRITPYIIFDSIYHFSSDRDSSSLSTFSKDLLRRFQATRSMWALSFHPTMMQGWRGLPEAMSTLSWTSRLVFLALTCPYLAYGTIKLYSMWIVYIGWSLLLLTINIPIRLFRQSLLSVGFVIWVSTYRYPLFEVIYPRQLRRILQKNSDAYSPLAIDSRSIRVVRLKSGENNDAIKCELVTGPLNNLEFEALSYVWGVSVKRYKVQVNEKPFLITHNLFTALRELRLTERDRILWIDAMCIDQSNTVERGSQVQMMRDIYSKASRTIIWFGEATSTTPIVFRTIFHISNAASHEKEKLLSSFRTQLHVKSITEELDAVLRHEWWQRVWVIQEAVVSQNVCVQRGSLNVTWRELSNFMFFSNIICYQQGIAFASAVQMLRASLHEDSKVRLSMLDLVERFRGQSATFGPDKIYSLMGLVQAGQPSLLEADYTMTPEKIFMQFTVSCLRCYGNLRVLGLAANAELRSASWCRNYSLNIAGVEESRPLHGLPGRPRPYCASGNSSLRYHFSLEYGVLSLFSLGMDEIVEVAGVYRPGATLDTVKWSNFVDEAPPERKIAFTCTVAADCLTKPGKQYSPSEEAAWIERYSQAVNNACVNRQLFVTRSGKLGIGPWNLKRGDNIAILMGGKTPFVLRKCRLGEKRRYISEFGIPGDAYKLVGEAHVNGMMYYEGNAEERIKSGEVRIVPLHLL